VHERIELLPFVPAFGASPTQPIIVAMAESHHESRPSILAQCTFAKQPSETLNQHSSARFKGRALAGLSELAYQHALSSGRRFLILSDRGLMTATKRLPHDELAEALLDPTGGGMHAFVARYGQHETLAMCVMLCCRRAMPMDRTSQAAHSHLARNRSVRYTFMSLSNRLPHLDSLAI
jgi:hypothetical protein